MKTCTESESSYIFVGRFLWDAHPICCAIKNNDFDALCYTIDVEGENPSVGYNKPIWLAVQYGNPKIVHYLLSFLSVEISEQTMLEAIEAAVPSVCLDLLNHEQCFDFLDNKNSLLRILACINEMKYKLPYLEEFFDCLHEWFDEWLKSISDTMIYDCLMLSS